VLDELVVLLEGGPLSNLYLTIGLNNPSKDHQFGWALFV
jgi:hypothetical protein